MRSTLMRLLLLAAALALAGCASTSIRSAWFDASYSGGAFRRILVVGVHGSLADTYHDRPAKIAVTAANTAANSEV